MEDLSGVTNRIWYRTLIADTFQLSFGKDIDIMIYLFPKHLAFCLEDEISSTSFLDLLVVLSYFDGPLYRQISNVGSTV